MRALSFSPLSRVLVLPFFLSMIACNVVGESVKSEPLFSLEYRVHRGLDCAMLQDCGFVIEVSQTGELTRYEDPGTGDLTKSTQRMLTQQDLKDLQQLLEETGFFDFPSLLPTEDPRAGGGSVQVTYTAWPEQTNKSVMILKGRPLPEEATIFMSRLDLYFSSRLNEAGRKK